MLECSRIIKRANVVKPSKKGTGKDRRSETLKTRSWRSLQATVRTSASVSEINLLSTLISFVIQKASFLNVSTIPTHNGKWKDVYA